MIDYTHNITSSGLSIYDEINPSNTELFIPLYALEIILSNSLVGVSLAGLPLRTRSKVVKAQICEALGYPIPRSFKKTQPRFPGQNFDVYTQKSMNVQIWNEEVDASRRYVFLQVDEADTITTVRVITGDELVKYDRTGRLTTKYQATMHTYSESRLFSPRDTETIENWISQEPSSLRNVNLRYVIFDGIVSGSSIILRNLYLTSGADFNKHFPIWKGKNAKIQLPLPSTFFD